MRSRSFDRWAALAGPLFVVLLVIGGPVLSGSTPEADASPSQVIDFYSAHRTSERAAAIVLAVAFLAFLLLAGSLRARWRRNEHSEPFATMMLGAAVVAVVGQTVSAGIVYALADAPRQLAPAAAQTLNLLQNDLVLTSAVGLLAFGVTAGLAILRDVELPAWIGWLAVATGVLFVVPPAEFLGLLLLVVWTIAVSLLSLSRDRRRRSTNAGEPQPEPV